MRGRNTGEKLSVTDSPDGEKLSVTDSPGERLWGEIVRHRLPPTPPTPSVTDSLPTPVPRPDSAGPTPPPTPPCACLPTEFACAMLVDNF